MNGSMKLDLETLANSVLRAAVKSSQHAKHAESCLEKILAMLEGKISADQVFQQQAWTQFPEEQEFK
jgi:transposase